MADTRSKTGIDSSSPPAAVPLSSAPLANCRDGSGGHFNPANKPHAYHGQSERHAGDLPSLVARADGTASFRFESGIVTVAPEATSVAGRGIVVHRDPDDYKTQPTGNSGPRLACGVIAAAR